MRAGKVNANSMMKKAMTSFGFRQFRAMKNILSATCSSGVRCGEQGRAQSSLEGLAVCLGRVNAAVVAQDTHAAIGPIFMNRWTGVEFRTERGVS